MSNVLKYVSWGVLVKHQKDLTLMFKIMQLSMLFCFDINFKQWCPIIKINNYPLSK